MILLNMSNLKTINRGVLTTKNDSEHSNSTKGDEGDEAMLYKSGETQSALSNTEYSETLQSSCQLDSTNNATSEEMYKMKACGKKGKRSPTRIEFELVKTMKKRQRGNKNISLFDAFKRKLQSNPSKKCVCSNTKSNYVCQCSIPNRSRKDKFHISNNTNTDQRRTPFNTRDDIKKLIKEKDEICERMEIYYFDHGNSAYFQTTDCPPHIASEAIAQQTCDYTTRFWAEVYGSIHIGIAFFVAFILQTYRFILYSIIRPLIVGFFQMTSDYLIKPVIAILFNGIIQPPLIFLYNVFSTISDMLEPVGRSFLHLVKPISHVFQSIHIIQINKHNNFYNDHNCDNNEMNNNFESLDEDKSDESELQNDKKKDDSILVM